MNNIKSINGNLNNASIPSNTIKSHSNSSKASVPTQSNLPPSKYDNMNNT